MVALKPPSAARRPFRRYAAAVLAAVLVVGVQPLAHRQFGASLDALILVVVGLSTWYGGRGRGGDPGCPGLGSLRPQAPVGSFHRRPGRCPRTHGLWGLGPRDQRPGRPRSGHTTPCGVCGEQVASGRSERGAGAAGLPRHTQCGRRLAVPRLADWCAVDVVDAEGRLHRLAIAHVDPAKVEAVWAMSHRYRELAEDPVPQVVRSGRAQIIPIIPDELLRRFARDEDHLRGLRAFGLRSLLIVPLTTRDRTLGAITFVTAESGRQYSEADLLPAEPPRAPGRHGGGQRPPVPGSGAGPAREGNGPSRCSTRCSARADRARVRGSKPSGRPGQRRARLHDGCAGRGRIWAARSPRCWGRWHRRWGRCSRRCSGQGAAVLEHEIASVSAGAEACRERTSRAITRWPRPTGKPGMGRLHRHRRHPSADTPRGPRSGRAHGGRRPRGRRRRPRGQQHDDRDHRRRGFLEGTLAEGDTRAADVAEIRRAADRAAGIAPAPGLQPATAPPAHPDRSERSSSPTAGRCSRACWARRPTRIRARQRRGQGARRSPPNSTRCRQSG